MITDVQKKQIVEALISQKANFAGADGQYAVSLGINKAVWNRIKKGDYYKVLSEAKWTSLARRAGISLSEERTWQKADTPVFQFITAQLEKCQEKSLCSLLCDMSDIGKTFAAKYYAQTHKNAVYVDCSQVKSKQKFIRTIAKGFGVDNTGKYIDVYDDLVFYLKTLDRPIIIIDEAGDLHYEAFLELKALYNAIEYQCAFYMTGADGLKAKMERAIDNKKVGYAEIFSRFGKKYGAVVPVNADEREKFLSQTAAMIIKANAPEGTNVNVTLRKTMGDDNVPSLRRIYTEFSKAI
jgi:DNA transposition AAA+ family ATPase